MSMKHIMYYVFVVSHIHVYPFQIRYPSDKADKMLVENIYYSFLVV